MFVYGFHYYRKVGNTAQGHGRASDKHTVCVCVQRTFDKHKRHCTKQRIWKSMYIKRYNPSQWGQLFPNRAMIVILFSNVMV